MARLYDLSDVLPHMEGLFQLKLTFPAPTIFSIKYGLLPQIPLIFFYDKVKNCAFEECLKKATTSIESSCPHKDSAPLRC